MTQKFKGDTTELQMEAAGSLPFDICTIELESFLSGCYDSNPFLLMLYDAGRMPFVERVPRDAFIGFIKQAIPNFPTTGTFETYLFILKSIFGPETVVFFEVPAPGKITMLVSAGDILSFDWVATEFNGVDIDTYSVIDNEGDQIQFQGIAGIDSQAELEQLLSELIPAGIYPDITLAFFELSEFISEEGGDFFLMVDHLGNQIIFFEIGD